ncbi:MAG: hypothetical protein MJ229_06520 [bacterium]|nr:hypothetical protein [bacterium]
MTVAYFFTYQNITSEWFDWLNYHHYNAWAFLKDRLSVDFFAANSRTYFCPYVEVFNFVTLNLFQNHAKLFVFVNCFDSAIFLFLAYKISEYFYSGLPKCKFLLPFLSIPFFVFCVPEFREAQDFSHAELFISNIVLLAMLLFVPAFFEKKSKANKIKLCVGGSLLGLALGFKLTTIVFVLGLVITVLLLHNRIENKLMKLLCVLIPCFVVFFVMDFYWFYKVYLQFNNPFFPYFNDLFHSIYIGQQSFMNVDFGHLYPEKLYQFILFPVLFFNKNRMFGYDRCIVNYLSVFTIVFSIVLFNFYTTVKSDFLKKDRFVKNIYFVFVLLFVFGFYNNYHFEISFLFILAVLLVIYVLGIRKKNVVFFEVEDGNKNLILFVLGFYFVSYYVNLLLFACNRYILLLFVGVYLILVFVTSIVARHLKFNFVCLFIIHLLLFGTINKYDYKDYDLLSSSFATVKAPNFKYEDNSVVLVGSYLVSAIIPYQNEKVSYRLFANPCKVEELSNLDNMAYYSDMFSTVSDYSIKEVKNILEDKTKKVYLLYGLDNNDYFRYFIYPGLEKYNTKREIGECYRDTMYYFDKKYDVASCELKYVEK